jgi:FtsH-binding integral membrane protein
MRREPWSPAPCSSCRRPSSSSPSRGSSQARATPSGRQSPRWLGLGLLATVAVAALPTLVVTIMAGPQYLDVTDEAWLFALAGAGFGVVQVILYARMAHHDRRATVLLWSGVAVLAVLGLTLGNSIASLVTCAAAVAWGTALIGVAWARTDPVRPGTTDEAAPSAV